MLLLFALSLIPFSTAYPGEQHFSKAGTLLYLASLLLPPLVYAIMQRVIQRTGTHSTAAGSYHRATIRKGLAATLIYLAGIALTFVTSWLGIACAALVAVLWFLPMSPLDRLFARASQQGGA